MADRQIRELTAQGAPALTDVVPVQTASGIDEAKKLTLSDLKALFNVDNANNITSGTLAEARLPSTVPLKVGGKIQVGDLPVGVAPDEYAVPVERFGAVGDGVTNDYPAFFAAAASGAKVILLNSKTYFCDNNVGTITQQLAGMVMLNNKYILGTNGSIIRFSSIATPLFTLFNCNYGGISGVRFIFTGNTITVNSQQPSKANFMTKLGVTTLSGGDVKEIGPIYCFNSNRIVMKTLFFESETPGDATKAMGIVITVRAKEDVPTYNYDLVMDNITFNDCVNGLLICSQKNFSLNNFQSRRRVGLAYYPPGHVIYYSSNNAVTENTGITTNVIDYGEPITVGGVATQNLATLSCKYIRNCSISNVTSYHPEGLIQSFDNANGNTLTNFSFYYDGEPTGSFMNFVGPTNKPCENNVFSNFKIITPNGFSFIGTTSSLQNLFNGNVFENFYFRMQPNYNTGQSNSNGVFDIYGNNNTINAVIELTEPTSTTPNTYNTAIVFRGSSTNNKVNIKIEGQYVDQRFIRALDTAGTSNRFDFDLPLVPGGEFFGIKPSEGSTQTIRTIGNIWGTGGTSSTGTINETFQLDAEGVWEASVTVCNTTRTSGVSHTYKLLWSPSFRGNFGTQSPLGVSTPWGTGYTDMTLSVDNTGLVTASYTKVPTGASRLNIGIRYLSGIGSNL